MGVRQEVRKSVCVCACGHPAYVYETQLVFIGRSQALLDCVAGTESLVIAVGIIT